MTKRKKYLVGVTGIVLVLAFFYFLLSDPLPSLGNVQNIKARFVPVQNSDDFFDVSSEHWSELYSALLPSRRDWSPSKWVIMGNLVITTTNGAKTEIDLYDLSEGGAGAFSIGDQYYRGGDSSRLKAVLTKAREQSERNPK